MALQISGIYRTAKNKLQHASTMLYDIYAGALHTPESYELYSVGFTPYWFRIFGEDLTALYVEDAILIFYLRYQNKIYTLKARIIADSTFTGGNTEFRYNPETGFLGEVIKVSLYDVIHLTEYNIPLTFTNSLGTYIYQPFPIVYDKITNTNEYVFNDVSFEFSAVSRRMIEYIDRHNGMAGNEVFLYHFFLDEGTTSYIDSMPERYYIIGCSYDQQRVHLKLNNVHWGDIQVPRRRFIQDYCQWIYKSIECGYSGDLESCDHRLATVNGCMRHDLATVMENNSNVPLYMIRQLARFGAFPGVGNK